MAMPSLLQKAIRVICKALLVFVCLVLAALAVIFIRLIYADIMRTRYIDRLQRETKVPEQLVTTGEHPLASIFLGSEDQICVLHPYVGTRGLDDMTAGQLTAIRGLDLPSEEGTWYLVAFERDEIRRVLLITYKQVELASRPICFFRGQSGVIQVHTHDWEHLPLQSVEFHLKGE